MTNLLHLVHFTTKFIVERPSCVPTLLPHFGQYNFFRSAIAFTTLSKKRKGTIRRGQCLKIFIFFQLLLYHVKFLDNSGHYWTHLDIFQIYFSKYTFKSLNCFLKIPFCLLVRIVRIQCYVSETSSMDII